LPKRRMPVTERIVTKTNITTIVVETGRQVLSSVSMTVLMPGDLFRILTGCSALPNLCQPAKSMISKTRTTRSMKLYLSRKYAVSWNHTHLLIVWRRRSTAKNAVVTM